MIRRSWWYLLHCKNVYPHSTEQTEALELSHIYDMRVLYETYSKTCSINVKIDGHLLYFTVACLLGYFHQNMVLRKNNAQEKKIETRTNKMKKKSLANSENVRSELLLVVHAINKSLRKPIDLKPEHNVWLMYRPSMVCYIDYRRRCHMSECSKLHYIESVGRIVIYRGYRAHTHTHMHPRLYLRKFHLWYRCWGRSRCFFSIENSQYIFSLFPIFPVKPIIEKANLLCSRRDIKHWCFFSLTSNE